MFTIQRHCNFCTKELHENSLKIFVYSEEQGGIIAEYDICQNCLNKICGGLFEQRRYMPVDL